MLMSLLFAAAAIDTLSLRCFHCCCFAADIDAICCCCDAAIHAFSIQRYARLRFFLTPFHCCHYADMLSGVTALRHYYYAIIICRHDDV